MLAEQETDYAFKDELIRNYINLIIHEAVKMQPSETQFKAKKCGRTYYCCISGTAGTAVSY